MGITLRTNRKDTTILSESPQNNITEKESTEYYSRNN